MGAVDLTAQAPARRGKSPKAPRLVFPCFSRRPGVSAVNNSLTALERLP